MFVLKKGVLLKVFVGKVVDVEKVFLLYVDCVILNNIGREV